MENPESNSVYETDLVYFWFDENGILCSRQKSASPCYEKQKETYELIMQACNCERVCFFADVTSVSVIMYDEKTKEYIAEKMPEMFKAIAVLSVTTLQRVAPTIFMNTMNEPVPMQLFTTESEAKEWLKQYL